MIRVNLTVHYRDGTVKPVSVTQYALAEYGLWCASKGLPQPELGKTDRTVTLQDMQALRYWAWAELQRDATPAVRYEVWNRTVDEVTAADTDAVDPTGPAIPAG